MFNKHQQETHLLQGHLIMTVKYVYGVSPHFMNSITLQYQR